MALLEGDAVLFYCIEAKGFMYSPPPLSPEVSHVALHCIDDFKHSWIKYPGFPNFQFAAFKMLPWKCAGDMAESTKGKLDTKNVVYGQKVELVHIISGMYLTLSNKGYLSLRNKESSAEKTIFKILPTDRNKTKGKTIHIKDKIRLEVSDTKDQVICSPNCLKLSGYDLKTATDGSKFILYHHSSRDKSLALRGGEVVMFLNEDRDAYISSCGSTKVIGKVNDGISSSEDRDAYISSCGSTKVIGKVNDGISSSVFQGGDCFWQIEESAIQYNGDFIKCETGIRIKHLPTQCYLAVVEDKGEAKVEPKVDAEVEVEIEDDFKDEIEDEVKGKVEDKVEEIQLTLKPLLPGDYKDSSTVFHLFEDTSVDDTRILKKRYVGIRQIEKLKPDKEKSETEIIKHLSISKLCHSIDDQKRFTISLKENDQEFTDHESQRFWIEEVDSGLLEKFYVLSSAVTTLKLYKDQITKVYRPPVIDQLTKWTSEPSQSYQKRWPDMFRIIEGVDLILEFLCKETDKSSKCLQTQLCTVLKNYVQYASEESQKHFSNPKLFHILLKKIGQGINAEGVFSALVKSSSFPSDMKKKLAVELITKYENNPACIDSDFLELLSTVCLSGTRGRPDRTIQDDVLEKIIIPCYRNGVFIKVNLEGENVILIRPEQTPNDDKFLIPQIRLFANVCKGVNIRSIKTLVEDEKILTFNEALQCTEYKQFDPVVQSDVQSAFFTYLVSTLVDKTTEECGNDLENIWFIYAKKHFVEKPFDPVIQSAIAETIDIISHKEEMLKIQDKIHKSLRIDRLNSDIEAGEKLITQRLTILERLISYGFYWRDPEDVIEILIHILKKEVHVQSTESDQVIFKLQAKAVEILHYFLKQTYHLSTARILSDYFYFVDDICPDDFTPPKAGLRRFVNEEYELSTDTDCVIREDEARQRMKSLLYGDDDTYKLFNIHTSNEFQTHQQDSLENHLIRLLQCDNETLCLSSAKLLFDLYQGESHLFKRSQLAYIVHEESWLKYVVYVNYATFQDKPDRILLKLLQGEAIGAEDQIKRFTNKVVFDCGYIPDPLKTGRNLADETIVHTTRQDIVFSTGVFGAFLNYVIKFCSSNEDKQECLIKMVCDALVRAVRNNDKIKQFVFERFTDLLEAKLAITSVAHLLTEVLTDNITACRQLPVFVVRRIFRLAMRDDNPEYTEYITTLVAWMMVQKFPSLLLKNHQEFITSLLVQHFHHHYEENWDPEEILIGKNEIKIEKMLNITYLLAVCAEGEHKYAEDECRHIFPFEKLVSIIARSDIPIKQKMPFLFLLKEGYLNTKTKSLEAVVKFGNATELWDYFKDTTKWITEFNGILQEASSKDEDGETKDEKLVDFVKIKMRVLFSQHLSYREWEEHTVMYINRLSKPKDDREIISTKDQIIYTSTLLQYIVEGIVPLFSTFCAEFQECVEFYEDELSVNPLEENHKTILNDLGSAVAELVEDNRQIFLTTESQVKFWKESLCQLKSDYDPQLQLLSDKETPKEQKCIEEETLNDKFKFYLKNFEPACSKEPDPDDLFPKFPGFQKFLTIFFPTPLPTSEEFGHHTQEQWDPVKKNVTSLVNLLGILHKQLQQSLDSKEKATYDKLLINILQSLSGFLHCHIPDPKNVHKCAVEIIEQWQKVFVDLNVHKKALDHLDHVNDEVALHILGLLKHLTYNANQLAQNEIWECISSRESVFCERVYKLLENVIAVFEVSRPTNSSYESLSGEQTDGRHEVQERVRHRRPSVIEEAGNIDDCFHENIRRICIVFDCISNICDGQNKKMQKTLQGQETSLQEHHIVKKIAVLLQVLSEQYERFTEVTSFTKAIQALIETCAGHYGNQRAVFQCQITDTINVLLGKVLNDDDNCIQLIKELQNQVGDGPDKDREKLKAKRESLKHLSLKAIELLQVLLEETHKDSSHLIVGFTEDVDLNVIVRVMFQWEVDYKDIAEAIGPYHIFHMVADIQEVTIQELGEMRLNSEQKDVWTTLWDENNENIEKKKRFEEFKAHSYRIEVVYNEEGKESVPPTRVYFPYDPVHEFPEEHKEAINNGITEGSHEENLTEFTKWTDSIRNVAKYRYSLFKNHEWIYYFIYETSGLRHYILIFLTLLLNILVLSVFQVPESQTTMFTNSSPNVIWKPNTPLWYSPILLIFLGIPHLLLGICMVVEYFVRKYPTIRKENILLLNWFKKQFNVYTEWVSRQESLKRFCRASWREKKTYPIPDQYFGVDPLSFQSIYRVFFVVFSIAALILSGYFYCLCLAYIFLNSDIVQYMSIALQRSAKQLIYVALIGLVVILIFAVIAFAFLHDYMDDNENLFCSTLFECFITVSREGLLDTLGPPIPFTNFAQQEASFITYTLRSIFFDIPFFIIVTLIGLNIVTAILIDRFGELREERDKIKSMKLKSCFICGHESERFDRETKGGFKRHVLEDHNKWKYIYYMIYLDRKHQTNPNDMTAIEKQVYEKPGHIEHFPKTAKVLEE